VRLLIAVVIITTQSLFAQAPSFVSGSPTTSGTSPQAFSFRGQDANGASDIKLMYFLVNTTATIPANVCHGLYDQTNDSFWLFNDSLTLLQGPLTSGGGLSNSQCTLYYSGTSRISASGTDLVVNFNLGLNGSFGLASKNVYVWLVDGANNGTGWVQASTWAPTPAQTPALVSSSPATTTGAQPTFTFCRAGPERRERHLTDVFCRQHNTRHCPERLSRFL
jgi:hypothetical protein